MKRVFADTGYWYALLNPHDALHAKAVSLSGAAPDSIHIVTTQMVLAELLAFMADKGAATREAASRLVENLHERPDVEIVPQTSAQFHAALAIYRARPDKSWSLVDCASFHVMTGSGLTEALAHDRHFEQAGFVALLRG